MRLTSALILATSLVSVQALAAEAPQRPGLQGLAPLTIAVPEWHRPLPVSPEAGQLNGEADSRDIPFYVTPGEANRPAKLNLSYLNAISVMPTNLYGEGDNFDLANSHVLPALIRR